MRAKVALFCSDGDPSDDRGILAHGGAAQQMPSVAKGMNAAVKYVASQTIKPMWQNSQLLGTDLVVSVRELKASEGPDITLLGSGDVAEHLSETTFGYAREKSVALFGGDTPKTEQAANRASRISDTSIAIHFDNNVSPCRIVDDSFVVSL
jgi:hypothetical protein